MSNLSRIAIDHRKLQKCKEKSGYSLQDIAEMLGKKRATVGHYFTGKRQPSGDVTLQLIALFQIQDWRRIAKNFPRSE